jgi:uncharacterized membrane protein
VTALGIQDTFRTAPPVSLQSFVMVQDNSAEAIYQLWVGRGASIVEAIAVALIVGYVLIATLQWLVRSLLQRQFTLEHYKAFRASLGRAMLLGLEILIAADVVRTAALAPTLINFAALGLLVVVRSFLSWSIILELEGRWPWQARPSDAGQASE